MADSIRGDGLLRADLALEALLNDPEQLQRERERFSNSPPSYRSQFSGPTTRSQSPDVPSEAQQRRDERKFRLRTEHSASLPYYQFEAQYYEELERLLEADRNRIYRCPPDLDSIYEHARFNIKMRWIEQGIWNDEWNKQRRPSGQWKHEEPLKPESNMDWESMLPTGLFGAEVQRKQPAKSGAEVLGERRDREASRPYYQFIYLVSEQRKYIQEEMNRPRPPGQNPITQRVVGLDHFHLQMEVHERWRREGPPENEPAISTPPNINTTAYERVKSAWIKRGIWNTKWGVLPGMSWKHERPFEDMLQEELGDDPGSEGVGRADGNRSGTAEQAREGQDASRGPTYDVAETTGDKTLELHPRPHLFKPDQHVHVESSQRPRSRALGHSVQQTSLAKPPLFAGGEAGNYIASDPPDDAPGSSQNARSVVRRTQLRRRTAQSILPEPPNVQAVAQKLTGLARVSKTRKWKRPACSGRQEDPAVADTPAETRSSVTKLDVDEPSQVLADPAPRRSRRLQASSEGTDGLPDQRNAVRRSIRRTSASTAKSTAAKPEGVTKRRLRNRTPRHHRR
ncbi:hypothetical protein N656DRAFT_785680 [Canariomyces notabilis]|uniref:Uncharacterized protein n=1 Tax=Canariomyces notabilis TaxID=2074819 RepID=A0AAN6QFA0_9PEZI|nr:hypothetical protein N656DRAFT_785680 [Canariomyces arenarius]